jgi:3-hydroxymyristoyl/3-hydroxydecanoyl-(acyl carrier protein) dehydratase
MNKSTLHFSIDHPTGAGHFPGNPIIPGALLLAEVLRCIEQTEGADYTSCNVKAAKFLHPARPGDTVQIVYTRSERGTIEFQCDVAGTKVLTGAVSATDDA